MLIPYAGQLLRGKIIVVFAVARSERAFKFPYISTECIQVANQEASLINNVDCLM